MDYNITLYGDPYGNTAAQTDKQTPETILKALGFSIRMPSMKGGPNIRRESLAAPLNRMIDGEPGLPKSFEFDGPARRAIYYTEAPADRRAVFVMPWRGHTLVGTTEEPYDGDPAKVEPTEHEIDYLEATLRHYFPADPGRRTDAWAGLRVLPKGAGAAFRRPREVMLVRDGGTPTSLVSIYGGKLTGYRHTGHEVLRLLAPGLPPARRVADTRTLRLPAAD